MSSGPLTGEDLRLAGAWLGPWLVGGCLDIFLLGILLTQFRNYFTWYHDDKMSLRVIVAILLVGHILKTVHAFAIIWIQNIAYFGDLQGAILLNYTTWWQSGTPLIARPLHMYSAMTDLATQDGIFGFYVQIYFCYRLWMISKKLFVVVPVAIIFLFAFFSVIVATYFIATTNLPQISHWFAAHLGSVFAGDVCMTFLTAYFLIKSKADVLPQMVGLNSQSSALFNLAFSQKNPGGSGIISTAFNEMIPKLYAISMMYTLNARRTIRASHLGVTANSNEIAGGRSRGTRRQDIELGQIQVVTQTGTHVDVFPHDNRDVKAYSGTKSDDDESEQYK
ncbi:hypothetical protein MVEN_01954300 [Mycena venus]|uniref:Uncharacterized protein n=1 Tax=Mycena venus TaxID=2733690 RepID=A0A8H6XH26_9AGAR|nr:hypothetical protein MVEN_01954300 [Mycena venus]